MIILEQKQSIILHKKRMIDPTIVPVGSQGLRILCETIGIIDSPEEYEHRKKREMEKIDVTGCKLAHRCSFAAHRVCMPEFRKEVRCG